jgi:hypothetical protein
MRRLLTALVIGTALLIAGPASAGVTIEGTGEPAFTNTTTNTQWVHWEASGYEAYKTRFDYYDNNSLKTTSEGGQVAGTSTGSQWVNWLGVVSPLLEGHTYAVCATGRGKFANDSIWWPDGPNSCSDGSGKRSSTTIDLTKPVITVAIDNGAQYSTTGVLAYRINYTDNLAFPFPANFVCRDIGTDPAQACAGSLSYDNGCSIPANTASKNTFFTCADTLGAATPDGPVTLCVSSADAAVPDKPNSSDQAGSAAQANLSLKTCDSITLDRTKPSLSIAGTTTSGIGQTVSLSAQAADSTSGLTGAYSWSWGDGSPASTGAAPAHSYSAPGTYQVTVTTHDNAGNESSSTRAVTITAPPQQQDEQPQPTPDGGGQAPGGAGPPAPGAPGSPATPTPPAAPAVAAKLSVAAPKKIAAPKGKAKSIPLALTATGVGRATFALVRGGRIHAQGAALVRRVGTSAFKLKLPKNARPGVYSIKVSWVPSGSTAAQTRALKIVVGKPAVAKARSAAARTPLVDPVGAPFGLR